MESRLKQVDDYIAKTSDFAKPILMHLRDVIHKASPEIFEEIKWGMPAFNYKGFLCGMAAFKNYCSFSFWKSAIMPDPHDILNAKGDGAMGNFGQIRTVKELPADKIIIEYVKVAMRLNEEKVKVPAKTKPSDKKVLEIPAYFTSAIKKNKTAFETFTNFSYSNKKEYVEWVTEAKTEDTRNKRIATSVEWLSEGKPRMWKYLKK